MECLQASFPALFTSTHARCRVSLKTADSGTVGKICFAPLHLKGIMYVQRHENAKTKKVKKMCAKLNVDISQNATKGHMRTIAKLM